MAKKLKVLLLCGSLRSGSTNAAVLTTVKQSMPDDVAAISYPGMAELPHFNPDEDRDPLPPAVVDLRAQIATADALLICTPEYAGALPGSFKNLLDWTVGGIEIGEKPTGWINCSTNPGGAANAHASLRLVLGFTGAALVEEACVHVSVPRDTIGPDGVISVPEIRNEISAALRVLIARAGFASAAGENGEGNDPAFQAGITPVR